MILKILLVAVVIATVYYLFIKKKPEISKNKRNQKEDKTKTYNDEMVQCEQCGTYCAIDDTLLSNNKYYCSKECLENK